MNKFILRTLLVVIAVLVSQQYYSCKKIDLKREVLIKTFQATIITQTSAEIPCEIVDLGEGSVSEHGVVYVEGSSDPTIDDQKKPRAGSADTGVVVVTLTDLTPGNTYKARGYLINSDGAVYGSSITFQTLSGVVLPSVSTANITNITATSAVGGGNVTDNGGATVTVRGICWSASPNPTVNDPKVIVGNGLGIFSANLTNLEPNTSYYVRAFAKNSVGTAYGDEVIFQTIEIPTVITANITNITTNSAVGGGNVTDDGGATVTARGICWNTLPDPTISDFNALAGSGLGIFSANLTNLNQATTYYVRAYATNSFGTAYGDQKAFFTEGWLHYDDGINHDGIGRIGGGSFDVAIRFTPTDLTLCNGYKITKIKFFPKTGDPVEYTLEIFTGPNATNLEMLQDVTNPDIDQWNEVALDEPHIINASVELWVGYWVQYQPAGTYPAGTDEGPAIQGKGDMLSMDGAASWFSMSEANPDLNYNWNIQVYVTNEQGVEMVLGSSQTKPERHIGTDTGSTEISSSNSSKR
nr:hypothetical protein [Bacteroidota bacterium]